MTTYIALLRAVNVGGFGQLAMADLRALAQAVGLLEARTHIASGNLLFQSAWDEARVKAALEERLREFTGRPVGVLVRSAGQMARVLAANPFPQAPGDKVAVIFLDQAVSPASLEGLTGRAAGEEVALGQRELYVHYPGGMGRSRLRIPAAQAGTARNINTVAKLAALAQG